MNIKKLICLAVVVLLCVLSCGDFKNKQSKNITGLFSQSVEMKTADETVAISGCYMTTLTPREMGKTSDELRKMEEKVKTISLGLKFVTENGIAKVYGFTKTNYNDDIMNSLQSQLNWAYGSEVPWIKSQFSIDEEHSDKCLTYSTGKDGNGRNIIVLKNEASRSYKCGAFYSMDEDSLEIFDKAEYYMNMTKMEDGIFDNAVDPNDLLGIVPDEGDINI